MVGNGFGDINNEKIESLYVFEGDLYAVTFNLETGVEVWVSSNGTSWEQINPDGFGDGNNWATLWNSATITFQNHLYIGTWNDTSGGELWMKVCPAEAAMSGPNRTSELDTLRRFRDEVLAGNPTGEAYIQRYYQHAPELVAILLGDRDLRLDTARLIREFLPGVRDLLGEDGGVEMVLTRRHAARIKSLMDAFSQDGSPELQAELALIRAKVDRYQAMTLRQIWRVESRLGR